MNMQPGEMRPIRNTSPSSRVIHEGNAVLVSHLYDLPAGNGECWTVRFPDDGDTEYRRVVLYEDGLVTIQ